MTKFRDLLERTASTYVITLIGLLMAGGVFDATGTVHLDLAQKLLIAALPAAIAIPVNAIRLWLAQPPKSTAGDVLLRTVLTFAETFGGLLLASNVFDIGATGQMKTVAALGVASIPAALSFVKSWLASRVGTDSGSLDPKVGLGSVQPAPWVNEANPF